MKRFFLALIAVSMLVLGADSGNDLFQQALVKERTEGNPAEAVKLYQRIIDEFPGDRKLTAEALVQMGQCYEKLGQSGAQIFYQRVVREFADQQEAATEARARLAALLATSAEAASEQASRPVFRKITIPGKISEGAQLSPDGAKLAFVSAGEVWSVDLHGKVSPEIAGGSVRLTEGANAAWTGLTWARNGQWIAFNENDMPTRDISLLPASGGTPLRLTRSVPLLGGNVNRWQLGLSPDGRHLAYATVFEDQMVLQVVAAPTGETLMRLGEPASTQPAFSPDGERVAYVRTWQIGPRERRSEVRVVRLTDRNDVQFVTDIPGRARSPLWSPDGRLLAFLILRGGDSRSSEVWIAAVSASGEAATEPTKISLPQATLNRLAGWTADNKIGLLFPSPLHHAIYTVPLSGGKATQVTPNGDVFLPQWSPDGERLYFRGGGGIASVPAEGGQISVVPRSGERVTEAVPGGGNHISPDGTRIVFSGAKEGLKGVHLWTMPITGGEPVQLPMKPDLDSWCPRWSPNGEWIAFRSERSSGDHTLDENIYVVSSKGGEPRQLTNHADCFLELIAWSPDGNSIAYTCTDKTIRIIPFEGGEPRTVITDQGLHSHSGLAWTPDGANLVYSAAGRLRSVSTAGGEPAEINAGLEARIGALALSPNGQEIAFGATSGGDQELWLMEDFPPLVEGASQ